MSHLATELADVRTVDVAFEMERGWTGGWDLIARACVHHDAHCKP
jgi:hypothetical protein